MLRTLHTMKLYALLAFAAMWWHAFALPQSEADLVYCGEARYLPLRVSENAQTVEGDSAHILYSIRATKGTFCAL